PLAASMLFEKSTGRNPFYFLGGVKELDEVRDGVIRCQAAFGHSILAGIFGASLTPYFVSLWRWGGHNRLLASIGFLSSIVIVLCAGSSGPVMAFGAAMLGLLMWNF